MALIPVGPGRHWIQSLGFDHVQSWGKPSPSHYLHLHEFPLSVLYARIILHSMLHIFMLFMMKITFQKNLILKGLFYYMIISQLILNPLLFDQQLFPI